MWGFHEDAHEQVYSGNYDGQYEDHQAKFSHEFVAGAAAFEATKLYEDRQRREGVPVEHAFAKEMIAGIVGGEVDKLFETKGLDFLDRERCKREAEQQAMQNYDQHYGQYDQWHPDYSPPFDYNNDRYRY